MDFVYVVNERFVGDKRDIFRNDIDKSFLKLYTIFTKKNIKWSLKGGYYDY